MGEIRRAAPSDVEALAAMLSRAFEDDPVQAWLFPNPDRRRGRLRRYYVRDLRHRLLPRRETFTTDGNVGAACWVPPGEWRAGLGAKLRVAPAYLALIGPRLVRAVEALRLVERHHPRVPHWYLAHLGVEPAHQGHGVGSMLIAGVLARADRGGLPAYLESSKESNLAFYARHGFDVVHELSLPSGPPVWTMRREPR